MFAAGKGLDGYGMQAAKAVSPAGGRSWLSQDWVCWLSRVQCAHTVGRQGQE